MRPMNGGRFDLAYPKRGTWFYEPKYNGWRALVHAPTGTMFNRHGERLTIESEFKDALAMLKDSPVAEWFDMEGLNRRHNLCRGLLVILDAILPETYQKRRAIVEFYEGLVSKKADSLYTMQLRSSKEETRDWIKHRWEF